jgi:outer membrane protein
VPIFSNAEQQAREAQVQAQVAGREEALTQVEREVEADIWRNAKELDTQAQNLEAARLLAQIAGQSYDITFGRYKAGVGSILELLSTQAALSNARSQLTQAELGHAQARLRLEVASGTMVLEPK